MRTYRVTLRNASLLGLDDHGPCSAVLPARRVLDHLEAPKVSVPECWVSKCNRTEHEEAEKFLTQLGDAMVEVSAAAMCGDYYVQPFLIGPDEYRALRGYWHRLAEVRRIRTAG